MLQKNITKKLYVATIYNFWLNNEKQLKFEFITFGQTGNRINPFPNEKSLGSFKLKEFVDDDFNFDENGRNFSK